MACSGCNANKSNGSGVSMPFSETKTMLVAGQAMTFQPIGGQPLGSYPVQTINNMPGGNNAVVYQEKRIDGNIFVPNS